MESSVKKVIEKLSKPKVDLSEQKVKLNAETDIKAILKEFDRYTRVTQSLEKQFNSALADVRDNVSEIKGYIQDLDSVKTKAKNSLDDVSTFKAMAKQFGQDMGTLESYEIVLKEVIQDDSIASVLRRVKKKLSSVKI